MARTITLVFVIVVIGWLFMLSHALKSKPDPFTWSDQNGCQYLVKQDTLTPRLNPNGTQICGK